MQTTAAELNEQGIIQCHNEFQLFEVANNYIVTIRGRRVLGFELEFGTTTNVFSEHWFRVATVDWNQSFDAEIFKRLDAFPEGDFF